MNAARANTVWFVTGSQHLYGPETLELVAQHSRQMVEGLNADDTCAGLMTWMHTFSPAKMWIGGLTELHKPLLPTQFNQDIPWGSIDMDFMNLNQAAHGDREFGFITARMNVPRKVIAGY